MTVYKLPIVLTVDDLEGTPDDGNRYEVIDGDLYVSGPPSYVHQSVLMNLGARVWIYLRGNPVGTVVPGVCVVFDEHNAVVPDLLFASKGRLREVLVGGRLTGAPEIAVEILSPGNSNEKRDRHIKLGLYSTRGVDEYWILDPENHSVEIYRRSADGALSLRVTLRGDDQVTSVVLPGFSVRTEDLFAQ